MPDRDCWCQDLARVGEAATPAATQGPLVSCTTEGGFKCGAACLESSHKDMESEIASRWQRSKTWRSPSSPQIHQKYIYMWNNNSHRTPTECWQKTSDFPKGKKLPTYLGRAKEKRKNRDKRIGMGGLPWWRSG